MPKQQSIVGPVRVERNDLEGGAIAYELWDENPATYHRICSIDDEENRHAKADAEAMARAMNAHLGFFVSGAFQARTRIMR